MLIELQLKAFEEWALSEGGLDWKGRSRSGDYLNYPCKEWNRAWEIWKAASASLPEPVSIEEGAKALCRYEHGLANFDEAWASWHANFESLAEQVAVAWGLTCKS